MIALQSRRTCAIDPFGNRAVIGVKITLPSGHLWQRRTLWGCSGGFDLGIVEPPRTAAGPEMEPGLGQLQPVSTRL